MTETNTASRRFSKERFFSSLTIILMGQKRAKDQEGSAEVNGGNG